MPVSEVCAVKSTVDKWLLLFHQIRWCSPVWKESVDLALIRSTSLNQLVHCNLGKQGISISVCTEIKWTNLPINSKNLNELETDASSTSRLLSVIGEYNIDKSTMLSPETWVASSITSSSDAVCKQIEANFRFLILAYRFPRILLVSIILLSWLALADLLVAFGGYISVKQLKWPFMFDSIDSPLEYNKTEEKPSWSSHSCLHWSLHSLDKSDEHLYFWPSNWP